MKQKEQHSAIPDQETSRLHSSKLSSIYAIPLGIATVVIVGIFLHFISDAFLTFVAALFLANIFMPLVALLQKKKVPMVFVILLVLTIVASVLFGLVVVIDSTINSLVSVMPHYQERWDRVLLPALSALAEKVSPDLKQQLVAFNFSSLLPPEKIVTAISSLTTLISSFALILLFMLFILASHGQFRIKIERAFPRSGSFHLKQIVENIESRVRRYLLTTLVINTVAGVAMTVVLALFGVDLAVLWGMLTFLLMFIPSIGSIFAISMPLIVCFLQFDYLGTPIIVSIIVIVSQLLIGSYISPKVMGSSLNLSPLLILISIIFWGWVWGPIGMILAVPITSAITIIFENIQPLQPLAILMSAGPPRAKRRTDLPTT
ncbi:MAG: AI-2E family transporter [Bacteroidota bacterium]|nr:AI-2E family transporter [Bacteroidota bacterium]MDP4229720.1 AI-2E family transporter [Bacteroidota bacterium]MDP4235775.1 AI-2E family transporter [Bacteroidota bacterium]